MLVPVASDSVIFETKFCFSQPLRDSRGVSADGKTLDFKKTWARNLDYLPVSASGFIIFTPRTLVILITVLHFRVESIERVRLSLSQ